MRSASLSVGRATWAEIVEHSGVPTIVVAAAPGDVGRVDYLNGAARSLLGRDMPPEGPWSVEHLLEPVDEGLSITDVLDRLGDDADTCLAIAGGKRTLLNLCRLGDQVIVQSTAVSERAVADVIEEQAKFRGALLELSQLAAVTSNDEDFYQHFIERSVDAVPGAQGGSLQLRVPGTERFRFVAALGYDLVGLQQHCLEQRDFFRDVKKPEARVIKDLQVETRSDEIADWLNTVGRLDEIKSVVSAPVMSGDEPVAMLSLDNFDDRDAFDNTSVEMTTVLSQLIGVLWRRRELESELRREREAFRRQAMQDPLTGLANRRNMTRLIEDSIAGAFRRSRPSALLYVDVDNFKTINDELGHAVGDQVLVQVAKGLTEVMDPGYVVARWGGDEFVILPFQCDSINTATAVAQRIIDRFSETVTGPTELPPVAVSVGVGWSENSRIGIEALLRLADSALYEAKGAGRGSFRTKVG